jgi:hypothetical protein
MEGGSKEAGNATTSAAVARNDIEAMQEAFFGFSPQRFFEDGV